MVINSSERPKIRFRFTNFSACFAEILPKFQTLPKYRNAETAFAEMQFLPLTAVLPILGWGVEADRGVPICYNRDFRLGYV